MNVTVAVCTWNRARILDQTLSEMCKLHIPDRFDWELLVVNNNCTDHTDDVIAKYKSVLPVRRAHEPVSGKALAANRAVAEAKGEVIIWADDDVLPVADWLAEYVGAFEKWPDCALFGGPIIPFFEGDPPKWLTRSFDQVANAYAKRDFGDQPVELTSDRIPFGPNYAVRRDVQRRYPFDVTLGVNGGQRIGGYETNVMRQILADGHGGRWVPGASLRHFVRKSTQTQAFLRHYYAAQGAAYALKYGHDQNVALLFGRPRWLLRRAIEAELKYRIHRLVSPPETWVRLLKDSSELWGRLRLSHRTRTETNDASAGS